MKKSIIVAILSLFVLGIWGNTALANQSQIKSQGNTKDKVKVQQKKGLPKTNKEQKQEKVLRQIKLVDREFTDVQNDWAREEVLEATVKGYVYGYEDFTFRPSATVSKMETLTLIMNAKGYADEVKNYVLTDEQKTLLTKIPDWGKNYVALALEKGILTKEEVQSFNPQQAAKRYEVCMYMSRILDQTEINQDTGTGVFNDENQIPAMNKKDVRLMWTNGIVKGYPDGSFQPMKAVKRNELITMLNKLDDNCLQSFASSTVTGSIKEVKAIEGGYEISVVNKQGETLTVKTNAQTKLSYEGKLLTTTIELNAAKEVKILVNADREAVLVRILAAQ